MILVTTAGKVGTEAVRLLAERQLPVRVLVRDPAKTKTKAKALVDAGAGAQVVVGDLEAPASIDAAMAGVTAVVLVSPAVPAQELNVVASAARAGVRHIVKVTSKASPDSPIARRRGQSEIEAGLAASGVPHTLLRANAYMQNALAWAPEIAKTGGFGSAAGNGRTGLLDARDVAAVAAEIAATPTAHVGKTYWLSGPQSISNDDVAAVLSRLLARTVTYRGLSFEEHKDAMIRAGVPERIAHMNAQAFSLTAEGDAEWVTQDVPTLLGRQARSFEQFAADHAASFV
ncbi:NmrA family NAD(P)-binding protein (plasmid) [Streptomyces sp. CWNU-52B]|uniref:NmrA family NAD(P)-binding protein n=1 Tax=unclassified Streptomyces TaxID=2593676 RepID=UPI0039BFD3D9